MGIEYPVRRHRSLPSWAGAAFIIEAMLLLVFLIASVAVFTQLFAASIDRSARSENLTKAVTAAENTAERFAVDPSGTAGTYVVDNLTVVCESEGEDMAGGVLYHATITVYASGIEEPVYTLATSSYESEVR